MIEMCDGRDGQGGAMSHAQKASDRTMKNEAAGTEPAPTTESGQHASATLLLDLAASAKSAAAGSQKKSVVVPSENNTPSHSHLPAAQTIVPQYEETRSTAFPPRFDEIVSPFIHAADYAAGKAMRDNVLGSVMSELGLEGSNEEGVLVFDEFIRGKTVRLERTGYPADESRNAESIKAQILPVLAKDAPIIASWYNSHGDKALSYTSKAWGDLWVQRCGLPDVGCEMIKLAMHEDNNEQQREVILGLAYFERSVIDRYPLEKDDSPNSEEVCGNNEEPNVTPGKKRRRDETDSITHSRMIRTTLLRGIRINPKYNPEVAKRLSGLSNRDSAISIGGIPAALVVHVLAQSLRFGTEAVGVHCPKIDTAEAFFEGLFHQGSRQSGNDTSNVTVPEDEDGRKYFRLLGNKRWEVLRAVIVQQGRLSDQK